MSTFSRLTSALAVAALTIATASAQTPASPALPSETPATLQPVVDSFDYIRREAMIAMRDGVKLHTVILVPKVAKSAPILFTRTPYSANALTSHANSSHLGPILYGYDNATDVIVEGGYIRVIQDIRGKYGSEGDYVMNRAVRGPRTPPPSTRPPTPTTPSTGSSKTSRRPTAKSAYSASPTTASSPSWPSSTRTPPSKSQSP